MEIVPGSEPRVLLKAPEDVFFFEPMDWSGDGQRLYSAIRAKDRTWRLASVSTTDGKVQTLKNLGWRFNSTNDDDRARLSPDGRFLVYAALPVNPPRFPLPTDMNTNRHLYLLATDGSSESELIRSSGNNLNPVWTADGLQVLFTGNRSGSPALWSIAVRKGQAAGKEALASSTVGNFGYRVSPAGTYYYNQLVQLNVSRVIAMEPGARRVAGAVASAGEIIDGLNPSWSPNGKLLAFSRANPTKGSELIVRNMENGEEKAFRNPLLIDSAALWMGDRRILKNMSNSQGGTSLFLLDVQTGQFTETIKLTATMRGGQPTHDGKTVFVIDADNKFVAMDFPSGGHRRTVYEAHIGSVIHGYRLRPQGDKFLLRIQKGTREVLAEIALDGSRYHEIFEGPAKLTGINWTPDGEGILFSQAVEGTQHRRVKTVARTGGQPADTGIELEDGGYFAVNPDGTRIVIHEREAVTELWALDNVAPPLK
jgi:Tol biopolymer transport system component